MSQRNGIRDILQEFSIPLIAGVLAALLGANLLPDAYHRAVHWLPFGDVALFGHPLDLHFIVNELFMVFFFGIAAKEITESCLPGGSLNPPRKALNPLFATLGGVVGPVAVFFAGLALLRANGAFDPALPPPVLANGWGVPTATDIALAWLVARTVFGRGHPAVDFLLLLAVADDAIGLVIIAVFYGDPHAAAEPAYLGLALLGMAVAWGLRRARVSSWIPYVALGGPLAWSGLILAHLHPALALVVIVPFLPGPERDTGLFRDEDDVDVAGGAPPQAPHGGHSPLHLFEHQLKGFVDFGLFFFGFTQAGVALADIGPMTWLILGSLVIGKTVGITLLGLLSQRAGFPLPERMGLRELVMAGYVAALGLTVALFVATAAFPPDALGPQRSALMVSLLGQAKMGALLSAFVGLSAIAIGRALRIGRR